MMIGFLPFISTPCVNQAYRRPKILRSASRECCYYLIAYFIPLTHSYKYFPISNQILDCHIN